MRKRSTNNTKRLKPKENQLRILKIYAFCQKTEQKTSGLGEHCWCYVSIYDNAPKKNVASSHLKLPQLYLVVQRRAQLKYSSHIVMVNVKATC